MKRCCHGPIDLSGYDQFLAGKLSKYSLPDGEMERYPDEIKGLPKPPAVKSGKW